MCLAGVHHITVSPPLLKELSETSGTGKVVPFPKDAGVEIGSFEEILRDEAKWRMANTLSSGGADEVKLVQAINIFAGMQVELEKIAEAVGNSL